MWQVLRIHDACCILRSPLARPYMLHVRSGKLDTHMSGSSGVCGNVSCVYLQNAPARVMSTSLIPGPPLKKLRYTTSLEVRLIPTGILICSLSRYSCMCASLHLAKAESSRIFIQRDYALSGLGQQIRIIRHRERDSTFKGYH